MHVDSYLKKGTTHHICEDYVLTGMSPYPHLIVCDGCSSSPNTDVGARILAHSAQCVLAECAYGSYHFDASEFLRMSINRACVVADSLQLDRLALDCTLMLVTALEPTEISVVIFGDGSLFYEEEENTHIVSLGFSHNAPLYPSYLLDIGRHKKYNQLSVDAHQTRRHYINGVLKHDNSHPIVKNASLGQYFVFDPTRTKYVGITTDGAESLCSKNGNPTKLSDAMSAFTNYKLTPGPFVKRTMKRAMKDYAAQNIENTDDIGIACLMIRDK
jgi:hypothetical protein